MKLHEQAPGGVEPGTPLLPHEDSERQLDSPDFEVEQSAEAPSREPNAEALGSLSLTEMLKDENIDREAAKNLIESRRSRVAQAFHKARKYIEFSPALAGSILHQEEPATQVVYPTAQQIKEQSFLASAVSGFLGFFSPRWAKRFDDWLERKAQRKLSYTAKRTVAAVDFIGDIYDPREQFIVEMLRLQQGLSAGEDLDEKLLKLGGETNAPTKKADNKHPLFGKLMSLPVARNKLLDNRYKLRAFAPEVRQGIEGFLQKQGREVEQAKLPEPKSLVRRLSKRFAPGKVEKIPDMIEATLTNIYRVLPEDGAQFKKNFYALCKKVSHAGKDGQAVAAGLLEEMSDFLGGGSGQKRR